MNKPDLETTWAIDEFSRKMSPLESQRQQGWTYQDTPSSAVVNGWMYAVHGWQVYLEQTTDEQQLHIAQHSADIEALRQRVNWLQDAVKLLMQPPKKEDPAPAPLPPAPAPMPPPPPQSQPPASTTKIPSGMPWWKLDPSRRRNTRDE